MYTYIMIIVTKIKRYKELDTIYLRAQLPVYCDINRRLDMIYLLITPCYM